jgi:hypothetical protein
VTDPDPRHFEQYKLAVEMADRISARRAAANGFFLTVISALVALLGIRSIRQDWVAAGGLVLAGAWWVLLRSYRDLNTAKFTVIQSMEAELPVRLFYDEWQQLKADPVKRWRSRYAELGFVERAVPLVFAGLFIAALVH